MLNLTKKVNSTRLSIINTVWGRYCFKRFFFGITYARDALQQSLDQLISDLDNTTCVADNIFGWDRTEAEHDIHSTQKLNTKMCNHRYKTRP